MFYIHILILYIICPYNNSIIATRVMYIIYICCDIILLYIIYFEHIKVLSLITQTHTYNKTNTGNGKISRSNENVLDKVELSKRLIEI